MCPLTQAFPEQPRVAVQLSLFLNMFKTFTAIMILVCPEQSRSATNPPDKHSRPEYDLQGLCVVKIMKV